MWDFWFSTWNIQIWKEHFSHPNRKKAKNLQKAQLFLNPLLGKRLQNSD